MTHSTTDAREIVLDGSTNFRDLGGLVTGEGRTVRDGRVFRSDALHALTAVDLDRLAGLHIATLIDLRSTREIEHSGPSPLVAKGTRVMHTPIMDPEPDPADRPDLSQIRMEELYAGMLSAGQVRFGEIFRALAEADKLPAVIHCAAGKDRTGVTVALLLQVLGVPNEAIVNDYAITDRNMVRLIERLKLSGYAAAGEYPAHMMRAMPETMTAFLHALDERHGSAEGYLASAGVTGTHLDHLRRELLTPPA